MNHAFYKGITTLLNRCFFPFFFFLFCHGPLITNLHAQNVEMFQVSLKQLIAVVFVKFWLLSDEIRIFKCFVYRIQFSG